MDNAGKNMYEKLTIRDKFMFGKVTKNPVIAQKMADVGLSNMCYIDAR